VRKVVRFVVGVVVVVVALGLINRFVFKGRMPVLGGVLNRLPVIGVQGSSLDEVKQSAGDALEKAKGGVENVVDKAKDAVNK